MSELMKEIEEKTDGLFRVEDDLTAEWCLEQIRNANEEKAKWKEFYNSRYQSVCETCDRTIANMEAMLHAYFDTVPHKVTKTQENYALPSGKLVFKQQEPEYIRDDTEVIEWLKANGGERFIKTKETLDWSGLKDTLNVMGETVADKNGVVIPCITATERPDIFMVELIKEG